MEAPAVSITSSHTRFVIFYLQLMLLNAMYGGLGQSIGAIIGGKMQSKFGTSRTFIYAGIFDACFAASLVAYLSVRKDSGFKNPQMIVVPKKTTANKKK